MKTILRAIWLSALLMVPAFAVSAADTITVYKNAD